MQAQRKLEIVSLFIPPSPSSKSVKVCTILNIGKSGTGLKKSCLTPKRREEKLLCAFAALGGTLFS
jgi:hypothetical protein